MEHTIIDLDPVYKYEKWLGFLTHCKPYEWYNISPDRKDRDNFIIALKQLHDMFGIVMFKNDYSGFTRIDPLTLTKEILDVVKANGGKLYTTEKQQQTAFSIQQSNDLPQSGTLGHQEKDSSSTGLKTSRKENGKETEW